MARSINPGSAAAARNKLSIPFAERLKTQIEESRNGCWLWTGYCYSNGYAALSWQGKQQLLHRLVYEHFIGPIESMEAVSAQENTRRAMRFSCVNGHPFTPENTYIPADGKRYCRECRRRRVREQRQRRSA